MKRTAVWRAHQHDDSCYEELLVCDIPESEGHHYDDSCYQISRDLVCAQAEHQHSNACYDEEGNLICGMSEHTHSRECYEENRELVCKIPESEGHHHDASCYKKVLTCGKEAHTYSEACYGNDGQNMEQESATDNAANPAGEGNNGAENSDEENATEELTDSDNANAAETFLPEQEVMVTELAPLDFTTILNSVNSAARNSARLAPASDKASSDGLIPVKVTVQDAEPVKQTKAAGRPVRKTAYTNPTPTAPAGYAEDPDFAPIESEKLSSANNWDYVFPPQPKYTPDGQLYYYYVVEKEWSPEEYVIGSYSAEHGIAQDGTITVTNLAGSLKIQKTLTVNGQQKTADNGYIRTFRYIQFSIEDRVMKDVTTDAGVSDKLQFTAANGNNLALLKITNELGAALPHTGGSGTGMIYLFGFILTGLAGAGLVMRKRRRAA